MKNPTPYIVGFFVFLSIAARFQSIPVSVMLELDTVSNNGTLNDPAKLQSTLQQLKNGGVDGVMTDVWWGLVENNGPKQYNWTPYIQLVKIVQSVGLDLQVVMSFHQCGGNVGDTCDIPLPQWVMNIGATNTDIFYKDGGFSPDYEYLSLGVDNVTIFQGRTAVQLYSDFMESFANTFQEYLGSTITQIQVGMGPAGEMRYPSYQSNKWSYCGVGEFQSNDKYMLSMLATAAQQAGHSSWGLAPPDDAGDYNSNPGNTGFWGSANDNYQSDYGEFFLGWYSGELLKHGSMILQEAQQIFGGVNGLSIAGKVAGIHWWYLSDHHAAENTAGYYNTNSNNAYLNIANMFAKYDASFDFTCLEMTDQDPSCESGPEELVKQTRLAANQAGIGYAGENALPICNPNCYQGGFDQVYKQSTQYGNIERFTFLRLGDNLLESDNFNMFTAFVQKMHQA